VAAPKDADGDNDGTTRAAATVASAPAKAVGSTVDGYA
jgi:hypothetical protein